MTEGMAAPRSIDTTTFEGALHRRLEGGEIRGWVLDTSDLKKRIAVDIRDNGELLATVTPTVHRKGLWNGVEGKFGFKLAFPPALLDGRDHEISAFIAGTDVQLRFSPVTLDARTIRHALIDGIRDDLQVASRLLAQA